MRKEESDKFHETADILWELAKKAKEEGYTELEEALIMMSDVLHARGSGVRKKYDSII